MEDAGPPSRKAKSDAEGGFLLEKKDKSIVDDEEDGQVCLLPIALFLRN